MTKIYTRSGDEGSTSTLGPGRVSKTDPLLEAYGTVDELSAVLGVARTELPEGSALEASVARIQGQLFSLGADLATPAGAAAEAHIRRTPPEWVRALEEDIDVLSADLPPLKRFILPGGSEAAATLHVARAVARRAERRVVAAVEAGRVTSPHVLPYMNRLSDWLFTAARAANAHAGKPDVTWTGSS